VLAAGTAPYTFSDVSFTQTKVDDTVTVHETFGGDLGTVSATDPSPDHFLLQQQHGERPAVRMPGRRQHRDLHHQHDPHDRLCRPDSHRMRTGEDRGPHHPVRAQRSGHHHRRQQGSSAQLPDRVRAVRGLPEDEHADRGSVRHQHHEQRERQRGEHEPHAEGPDAGNRAGLYFSDPALGGNKIGAPAPVGGVSINLTRVGGNPSSCTSYENTSSAFGGSSPQTVSS
jgi:hypothetical protein